MEAQVAEHANVLSLTIKLKGHSTPRTSVAHKKALYEPTLE